MTTPKVSTDIVESMAAAVYIDCGFNIQMMWLVRVKPGTAEMELDMSVQADSENFDTDVDQRYRI
ncbi:putative ribonuclease III, endonuclease domain superfamily [Helianthus annuus]|uniref:Ribonuclease III, endonuclease domain superfamily n=1 Tax=Helianthus annuus TaxID=4232 RepID=A0A9K3IZ51_HELAN|nr:putative ribonuclease III, endonuclease domain superfamily [Helianthus annuus]KAJ0570172.1 putative ribonuclease III, endonuclease domain superfamily [Helianthus annuus]KAJ0576940.1 putative ribonuclease III, endonuclease domain superfamily [Helianthus annuus]KAJ0584513.1 putative ribonuclease III, endonuclease domain superfamily [Helianthus annuus]KAJ0747128.1 putative ribonuclease III, endonuclease domain superfamily [Helianthus annuus]